MYLFRFCKSKRATCSHDLSLFAGLQVPGVPAPAVGVQQAMATPVAIPLPTQCIMLLNMFDPTK